MSLTDPIANKRNRRPSGYFVPFLITFLFISGCETRRIQADGSSTVYPISEALAEDFRQVRRDVNVTVGVAGTGGGFKRFCSGEIDLANASRPIKETELEACRRHGVEFIELAIAYDGLAIFVSPQNDFLHQLSVENLKKIFSADQPYKNWKELDPEFPDLVIKTFAPGKDSGTYDYFVETVVGKKGQLRPDTSFSEDDNVLVVGVSGNAGAIGFAGLAYCEENIDKIRKIAVVNPTSKEAVVATTQTINLGSYAPLSRPLFLYLSTRSLERPFVDQFMQFTFQNVGQLAQEVGYIALPEDLLLKSKQIYTEKKTGSRFMGENHTKALREVYANAP